MTADQLTEWASSLAGHGIDLEYADPRRHSCGDVVVEQHQVRLTQPDGTILTGDVCVVLRFGSDGLIVALDEYLDSALFTPS